MKTEEFNLSEKIKKVGLTLTEEGEAIIIEDVKEFIRRLKEEFKPKTENPKDLATSIYPVFKIRQIIDKLAGDKLTK